MKVNSEGLKLIHSFESCRLQAYLCPADKWTIGWGCTFYENGTSVKKGDKITQERADQLFQNVLSKFEKEVKSLLKVELNSNQFSAITSFAYNCGIANLKSSTLLRKLNANPNDKSIAAEFAKWNKSNKKVLEGLIRRRVAEAGLYFKS